jgi:hypothetical protein
MRTLLPATLLAVLAGPACATLPRVARFEREPVDRPMPGPGPKLRFAGSTCPVGPREP